MTNKARLKLSDKVAKTVSTYNPYKSLVKRGAEIDKLLSAKIEKEV